MNKIVCKNSFDFFSKLYRLNLSVFFLVTCIFLIPYISLATSEIDQSISENQEITESFSYALENRKDPFVPFLSPKSTSSSVDMNEIVETEEELTGMQLFEPGQLKLVALFVKDSVRYAMVEDVTGKGYILSQGTEIGRRGVVKDIIPNKVLIEETAFTRAGKKIVTQVVMVLKKEGEE
jgi:hypothetical protein